MRPRGMLKTVLSDRPKNWKRCQFPPRALPLPGARRHGPEMPRERRAPSPAGGCTGAAVALNFGAYAPRFEENYCSKSRPPLAQATRPQLPAANTVTVTVEVCERPVEFASAPTTLTYRQPQL